MLLALAFAATPQASTVGLDVVDPATYRSRSGAYELHVDPTRPDGAGGAECRMMRNGVPVWEKSLGVTPIEVRVTDRGVAAGCALSEGRHRAGFVRIVILGADGSMLLEERIERQQSKASHGPPTPSLRGIHLLDDRILVIRVQHAQSTGWIEEWRTYDLLSCERLHTYRPEEELTVDAGHERTIAAALELPGRPLVLLWGTGKVAGGAGAPEEVWFALLNARCQVVWTLEHPEALTKAVQGQAGWDLFNLVRRRGAIFQGENEGSFCVWLPADHIRVGFDVERDTNGPTGWLVRETSRTPFDGAREPMPEPTEPLRLKLVASVPLERGAAPLTPDLGPIVAWDVDGTGVHVLRLEGGRYEHILLDSSASEKRQTVFDALPDEPSGRVRWCRISGEQWLVTVGSLEEDGGSKAFLADASKGTLAEVDRHLGPRVDAIAATPGGGFVILSTRQTDFALMPTLVVYTANGDRVWSIRGGGDDETVGNLGGPVDLTVLADGTIAVLDNLRKAIQLFDSEGTFLRLIDLEIAWGVEPNYLAGIDAAPDGGFLVYDYGASPSVLEVDRDGAVRRVLDPQLANGHRNPSLRSNVRYAPDGSLWTTDGDRIYRLDERGKAVVALGTTPAVERLRDIGPAAIDRLGRVCVQDELTGVLHVWNADGKKLLVAKPDPRDFERISTLSRITVGPDGGFCVEVDSILSREVVLFGPDGARRQKAVLARAVDYMPGTAWSFRWGPDIEGLELLEKGELLRIVTRLPSRRWVTKVMDVFPFEDGAFALLADGEIGFYGPDGAPHSSIPLPWGGRRGVMMGHQGPGSRYLNKVTATDQWALASSFEREAWLADRSRGSAAFVSVGDLVVQGSTCAWSLAPNGKELWVLDKAALVLHRFALP